MTLHRRLHPAGRAPLEAARFTRFPPPGDTRGEDQTETRTQPPEQAPAHSAQTAPRSGAPYALRKQGKLHPLVPMFVLATLMPLTFSLGSLALTPARIVMVLVFVPVMMMYLAGRGGRMLWADRFIFLYAGWCGVALFAYGGFGRIEMIGITAIEIIAPFLLARCLIRSLDDYLRLLKLLMWVALVLLVLSMFEAITGIRPLSLLLEKVARVYPALPINYERRLGLARAMTVFQHPILYGVAVACLFAPLWMVPRPDGRTMGLRQAWLAGLATFFSLSSGAWLGVAIQLALIGWNAALRHVAARWKILIGLAVAGYVIIDLLSNRTPFDVFISYMTLNTQSAFWRKLIFIYGMENVWANPLFGLGLGDWVRPNWMHSASIDNFWLLNAVRYGIPGFLAAAAVFAAVITGLMRARITSQVVANQRMGMIFMLVGLCFSIATVHIWGTALYFIWFLLGASSWMLETSSQPAAGADPAPLDRRAPDQGVAETAPTPRGGPSFARSRD